VWQFSKAYLGDAQFGKILKPKLDLATVVAVSAALPPLPPVMLDLRSACEWCAPPPPQFADPKFRARAVLCDGCASDLFDPPAFSAHHTVLVSDAGALFDPRPRPGLHWLSPNFGALNFSDVQIHARRKREALDAFSERRRRGAYWDIAGATACSAEDALVCSRETIDGLAQVPTALIALHEGLQKSLIDWGFAACDTAVRASLEECRSAEPPDASPYGTFYRRQPAMVAGAA
jgi:NTE family protein